MTAGQVSAEKGAVTREELYERVWSTPINHLAAEYGVSGSYLARVCAALNVPRPPVGYWQKKAVGKDKPRPPFPAALPGGQLTWARDTPIATPLARPVPVARQTAKNDQPEVAARHPILRGAEALFRRTRKVDDYEFLRPYKLLLPDIVTSGDCLTRALDLGNALYTALEHKGHRVMFASPDRPMRRAEIEEREVPKNDRKYGRYAQGNIWSPYRPTVTYVGNVPIGLAVTEMTERITLRYIKGKYFREDSETVRSAKAWQLANSWTNEQDVPTGRFRVVAYSPHRGVNWQVSWQETSKRSLLTMIPPIVRELERVSGELEQKQLEANEAEARRQRKWEEECERMRREDDKRQVAQAVTSSQKQLSEIIQRWSAAMSVEQFFREAENRIPSVEPHRRNRLTDRLALARKMMGTLDPLDFLDGWIAPEERYQRRYPDD